MKKEEFKKVWEGVFTPYTIDNLLWLIRRYCIDGLEGCISTGKEADVYAALAQGSERVAVKIYRVETSSFSDMAAYIEGDPRFEKVKKDKRSLVEMWARKEFRNLTEAREAGVRVPEPLCVRKNVLVMEFIGEENTPAPTLNDTGPLNPEKEVRTMTDWVKKLYCRDLVHADLSEFNILVSGEELVLIDMGQAVSVKHPKAREFLERDLANIQKYAEKNGIKFDSKSVLNQMLEEKK